MFLEYLRISSVGSEIYLKLYWLRCLLAFHKCGDTKPLLPWTARSCNDQWTQGSANCSGSVCKQNREKLVLVCKLYVFINNHKLSYLYSSFWFHKTLSHPLSHFSPCQPGKEAGRDYSTTLYVRKQKLTEDIEDKKGTNISLRVKFTNIIFLILQMRKLEFKKGR